MPKRSEISAVRRVSKLVKKTTDIHLQDHVKASKDVVLRRGTEVKAVLGFIPKMPPKRKPAAMTASRKY